MAVSSQGIQDHLLAKSANWLAGCVVNLVSNFMKSKLLGDKDICSGPSKNFEPSRN